MSIKRPPSALAGDDGAGVKAARGQLGHGAARVGFGGQPQRVAVFGKAGQVQLEVCFPAVVHDSGIHRAAVVLRLVFAQADRVGAHLAEIVQRHVAAGDQRAAAFAHKGDAGVRHRVLHAGAGQLVQPGAVGLAALLGPERLRAAQLQRQRQKDALDIAGQRLAQLQRKVDARDRLVQRDGDIRPDRAGQRIHEPQAGKDRAVFLAAHLGQPPGCQHGVGAADVAPQQAALLIGVGLPRAQRRDLVQRREERRGARPQQVLAAALVHQRRHAVPGAAVQPEPAVFIAVRQAEGDGVIVVDKVAHALGPHIAAAAVERFGQRRQFGERIAPLAHAGKIIQEGDAPPARVGRYLAGQLGPVFAPDARAGQRERLDVKFDRLGPGRAARRKHPQRAAGVIVAQRVALFPGNGPQQAAGRLVRFGGVAVFAHVQVQHHRVAGVGDGGGMPPGVLGIQQQGVLGFAAQGGVLFPRGRVQPPRAAGSSRRASA